MTAIMPVEFTRDASDGHQQRCGNRVLLEDANGNAYSAGGVTTRTLLSVCDTEDTQGDTLIIPAPGAGNRIAIEMVLLQNRSDTLVDISLNDGMTTIPDVRCPDDGSGMLAIFPQGDEIRLAEGAGLNINLSVGVECGYTIRYFVEAV